jgi:hypothetical protein
MTTKICPTCNVEKTIDTGFYKAGRYYQRLCKPCHNHLGVGRYARKVANTTKKKKGFSKLPIDTQKEILEHLNSFHNYKLTAAKFNIGYSTFMGWRYKNLIKLDTPI